MREPMPVVAGAGPRHAAGALTMDPASRRVSGIPFVDDGDPSADERTLAVTQAMEEIERRQGVTIIEVDERPSIGEEVEEAPPPPAASEEAEVQQGLAAVTDALEVSDEPLDVIESRREAWAVETEVQEEPPQEEYETPEHGLVPVPPADSPAAAWQVASPPAEEEGVRAGEEEAVEAEEAAEAPGTAEDAETPQADGYADEDPYAQGGLLRRLQEQAPPPAEPTSEDEERPFTTFDWRGRPLS
jgi:hypothetical protein